MEKEPTPINNEEALLAILSGEDLKVPELILNNREYYLHKMLGKMTSYSVVPEASADNYGKIIQYTGETTTDYTQGYFYKCVLPEDPTPTTTITAKATLNASVDADTFADAVSNVAGEYEFDYLGKPVSFIATYGKVAIICARDTSIDSGTAIGWTYTPPAGGTAQNYWTDTEYVTSGTTVYLDTTFTGKAPYAVNGVDRSTDEGFWAVEGKETQADLAMYGITVTEGKAEVGDAIKVNLTFKEAYYWKNIDVQAGGSTMKVVQTTGTSTTDVMSQNAVTSLGEEFVFTLADKSTATMTIPVYAVTTTEAPVAVANEVDYSANTVSDTVEEPVAVADAVVADTVEDPIIVEPETVETVADDIVEEPTDEVVENSETVEGE